MLFNAIDGSHIPIEAPHEIPNAYFNRKRFHSVILQGFAKITCHLSALMQVKSLGQWIRNLQHSLGDAVYPLRTWLLTPYRDIGSLSEFEARYNTSLSSNRQVIEHTFCLSKGRFRRLKYVNLNSVEKVSKLCQHAALFNICLVNE